MEQQPLISIIVPVYNVAPYLDRCLSSLSAQTYRRLEIIAIDDASTDGGGECCDRWAEREPRLQVVHLPQNRGLFAARNERVRRAAGAYLSFVDSDDWVEPSLIEGLYRCLRETGAEISICGTEGMKLRELRRNVGAMILHRVGAVAVFGTDHLLISRFVGVVTTGLYSNYILVRNFLNMIIEALSGAVTPALGSLNATAPREEQRKIFSRLHFLSACLFGWMSICLGCLYDPFIDLWLGAEYRLPRPVVLLIVVNFYVSSTRVPVASTKSAMGLFWDERYKSILEAAMNLAVSVLLARRYGITGILAGTLISTLTLPAWIEPLGLYRNGLGLPVKQYVRDYLLYALMTAAAGALTGLACRITPGGAGGFLLKLVLCLALPGAVYLAAARRFFHSWEPLLRLMEALPFGRGKRS